MLDKVHKGMECCVAKVRGATVKDCSIECPYFHEGVFCKNALHGDVKRIIQQLEARLAQVERERDELFKYLPHDCTTCRFELTCERSDECNWGELWQWRGVCPENTKEAHNV